MSADAANKEWKKYHDAVIKTNADNLDGLIPLKPTSAYMYDAYFAGFYAGRDRRKITKGEIL